MYGHDATREVRPAGNITLRAMRAVHPEYASSSSKAYSPSASCSILPLKLQENVRLEFFRDDGWWYGTSLSSGSSGWFAAANVDYLPGFKLGCKRCCECYAENPRFLKKLPAVMGNTLSERRRSVNSSLPNNTECHNAPRKITAVGTAAGSQLIPEFPVEDAAATALATTNRASLVSIHPMTSLIQVQRHYGRLCNKLEILSLSPLLLKLDGFLDGETCRKLIASAYERGFSKEESGCHGDEDAQGNLALGDGNSIDELPPSACNDSSSRSSAHRTSTACWLRGYDYETSASSSTEPQGLNFENRSAFFDTEAKIAALSGFPSHHQEPLQIVRYFPGQHFVPHMDWIDEYTQEEFGGRVITVLIYLQACKEGGATSFPVLEKTVPPVRGTALFWYNCHSTNDARNNISVDERLLHAGEPVIAGEKMVAVTWVHPFTAKKIRDE